MDSPVVFTNDTFREAVNLWFDDQEKALRLYRHISTWDTSGVTDMYRLFFRRSDFNEDLSEWNVSKVETMEGMFSGAKAFNKPIGGWDVSNVKTMEGMFYGATAFDKTIDGWNVSNVKTMEGMFYGATAFNPPIDGRKWFIPTTTKTLDFAWRNQANYEKLMSLITSPRDTN